MLVQQLELPSLMFVTLVTLFLGGIVFYRNRKSHSNILFFLLCFSFVSWSIINYFSLHPPFGGELFWIRLVLFSAAPQAFLFALFMHTFPKDKITLGKKYLTIFIFFAAVQMYLTLTPLVFKDITRVAAKIIPVPGTGMLFYSIVLLFFFSFGIYWLFRKLWLTKGNERKAMTIIVLGFILMIVLVLSFLLFAVIIFKNTTFIPLSPLFILPFILVTGYTLTRKKFLNIQLVATELVVGILAIVLLTEALLANSLFTISWKVLFSFFVAGLGLSLIQSVHREIRQKEKVTKLARSLAKANLRLQELDKQKTEFLSIASHQLRTPMSIIKGYIELIQDGAYGKISKETDKILNDMDETNERLVKLIDEFLDISRIEQGRTEFSFAISDMNKLINSVVKELTERANKKGLKIEWQPVAQELNICMDEEKIRHVIFNFIDNAIKYTQKGVIKLAIEKDKDGLTFRTIDSGLGFTKVDEANFFQKFYRGENVKTVNVTGTGLGIYVCRKFIEKHGGRVWAKSPGLNKGSEFGFWIPPNKEKHLISKKEECIDKVRKSKDLPAKGK